MRHKKLYKQMKFVGIELIKFPLSTLPIIIFMIGLIKIIGQWPILFRETMGVNIPLYNYYPADIMVGLALISLSITVLTLLIQFKCTVQGWLTSLLLNLILLSFLITAFATPLFDIPALRIFFRKGSCEFYLQNFPHIAELKDFYYFCELGNKLFS